MIVYEIENSLEGVLTAIFDSYLNKEVPDIVTSSNRYQARIDSVVRLIKTDNEKAERVKRSVMKYSSEKTIEAYSGEFTTKSDVTMDVENTHGQSSIANCQKIMCNGQLIIVRDGVEYNAMGVEL